MPTEVDPAAFIVDGTGLTTATIAVKILPGAIKANSIDGKTITFTGTAGGTAIEWKCLTTPAGLDAIAQKYFSCP